MGAPSGYTVTHKSNMFKSMYKLSFVQEKIGTYLLTDAFRRIRNKCLTVVTFKE